MTICLGDLAMDKRDIIEKLFKLILRTAYLFVLFGILLLSTMSVMGTVLGMLSPAVPVIAAAITPNIIMLVINALTALIARSIDRFTFLTHIVITFVHGVLCFSSFIIIFVC